MITAEEKLLIHGVKSGDPIAQRKLFNKYASMLLGVCLRYVTDSDEANDLLQESFIKIFDKIETFKYDGSFEGWIRRVTVNTCLDNYRKRKDERNNRDIDDVEYKLGYDDSALENLEVEDLLRIINSIPEGYRAVFNLYAIEGYSHKEIAVELMISVSTSKSQYSRAKKYIQQLILEADLV